MLKQTHEFESYEVRTLKLLMISFYVMIVTMVICTTIMMISFHAVKKAIDTKLEVTPAQIKQRLDGIEKELQTKSQIEALIRAYSIGENK